MDKVKKQKDTYHINLDANKGAPDSWCVLPWTHVSIKGNGAYRVCCHSAASESRGTVQDSEGKNAHIGTAQWEDVVNSKMMRKVRAAKSTILPNGKGISLEIYSKCHRK